MALEAATWLQDLVPANPSATDGVSQGDDHVRLLKQVLQTQWTSLGAAAVTATAANINLTKTLTADLALKAPIEAPSFTGLMTGAAGLSITTGNIDAVAGKLQEVGADLVPAGFIGLWSGAISAIPAGWKICDGTLGTPDLTDRFVIHADADSGGTNNPGDTGGLHTQSPTTDSQGSHAHTINAAGSHDHGAATGSYTLLTADVPSHQHFTVVNTGSATSISASRGIARDNIPDTNNNERYLLRGSSSTPTLGKTNTVGGDGGHSHTISSESTHIHTEVSTGGHTHTIASLENRPKFHALVYVQKT